MDKALLYRFADWFFYIFHIALIFFNLFGWIPRRWRKWNLATLLATAFSWLVLGIFYGFGYCFLTDWHFSVRDELGRVTHSTSYIHFLITNLTPIEVSEGLVNSLTAVFFFLALAVSLTLNILDRRRESR